MPKQQNSPPETAQNAPGDPIRLIEQVSDAAGSIATDLEHLERLATLGTISASIAHEINNLLTPIIAYAQLVRGRRDDPELLHKALDKAAGGAEAVSAIAQAMLNFARPSSSNEQSAANLDEVLDKTLTCLARHPSRDGVDLQISVPEDCHVAMQPLCLQQVMLNLIANSIHAMKRSRVGNLLQIHAVEDGQHARITIADNGPGLPDDVAATAFEPFRSSNPASTGTQSSGFGLGLWICHRLISQADGTIRLHPGSERGTTFEISLPIAKAAAHAAPMSRAAS